MSDEQLAERIAKRLADTCCLAEGAREDPDEMARVASFIRDDVARLTAENGRLREACRKAKTCRSIPDCVMEVIDAALAQPKEADHG
jgi:hypothetical protein